MKQLLLVCLAMIAVVNPDAIAQTNLDLQANDTIRTVLERQVGKPVELRMKSGEKIAGKLAKVTDKLAHLSQLADADFYDAAVEIDSVAVFVVRVRSKSIATSEARREIHLLRSSATRIEGDATVAVERAWYFVASGIVIA